LWVIGLLIEQTVDLIVNTALH